MLSRSNSNPTHLLFLIDLQPRAFFLVFRGPLALHGFAVWQVLHLPAGSWRPLGPASPKLCRIPGSAELRASREVPSCMLRCLLLLMFSSFFSCIFSQDYCRCSNYHHWYCYNFSDCDIHLPASLPPCPVLGIFDFDDVASLLMPSIQCQEQ